MSRKNVVKNLFNIVQKNVTFNCLIYEQRLSPLLAIVTAAPIYEGFLKQECLVVGDQRKNVDEAFQDDPELGADTHVVNCHFLTRDFLPVHLDNDLSVAETGHIFQEFIILTRPRSLWQT